MFPTNTGNRLVDIVYKLYIICKITVVLCMRHLHYQKTTKFKILWLRTTDVVKKFPRNFLR